MPMHSIELTKNHLNRPIYVDDMVNEFGFEFDFDYESEETAAIFTKLSRDLEKFGENTSYPVGAIYYGINEDGRKFFVPCVNTIPDKIKDALPKDENGNLLEETIGGSHATSHAEFVGMLALPKFENLSLATSKTVCPTCLEGLCELSAQHKGTLDNIYSDTDSLNGDSAKEKWVIASPMIKSIGRHAQIGIHLIDTFKRRVTETLSKHIKPQERIASQDSEIEICEIDGLTSYDELDIAKLLKHTQDFAKDSKNSNIPNNNEAVSLIVEKDGKFYAITAAASLPPGFNQTEAAECMQKDTLTDKRSYKFVMDALKRAKIKAVAEGFNTHGAMAVCTQLPTSGMLINAAHYRINTIVTPQKGLGIEDIRDLDKAGVFMEMVRRRLIKHMTAIPNAHIQTTQNEYELKALETIRRNDFPEIT